MFFICLCLLNLSYSLFLNYDILKEEQYMREFTRLIALEWIMLAGEQFLFLSVCEMMTRMSTTKIGDLMENGVLISSLISSFFKKKYGFPIPASCLHFYLGFPSPGVTASVISWTNQE
ncbi:hypothetical protein ACJX0J_040246, partial [Zea mays]